MPSFVALLQQDEAALTGQAELYQNVFAILASMANAPSLAPVINGSTDGSSRTILQALTALYDAMVGIAGIENAGYLPDELQVVTAIQTTYLAVRSACVPQQANGADKPSNVTSEADNGLASVATAGDEASVAVTPSTSFVERPVFAIVVTHATEVSQEQTSPPGLPGSISTPVVPVAPSLKPSTADVGLPSLKLPAVSSADYDRLLAPIQMAAVDSIPDFGCAVDGQDAGSNMIRAAHKELRRLKAGLPLTPGSSIFLRYEKARPYRMRFIITGPQGTPYDSGMFVFDVSLPPQYPTVPPVVKIMTTGGGNVRFNPNLYACGTVCLSLLGTWSGEPWRPGVSTLLQVLVSVQALILVEEPYYNEPGRDGERGTKSGAENSRTAYNGGWEMLRLHTLQWAVMDMLRQPPAGFEEVVRQHFRCQASHVVATVQDWLAHARQSPTGDYASKMTAVAEQVLTELKNLEYPSKRLSSASSVTADLEDTKHAESSPDVPAARESSASVVSLSRLQSVMLEEAQPCTEEAIPAPVMSPMPCGLEVVAADSHAGITVPL